MIDIGNLSDLTDEKIKALKNAGILTRKNINEEMDPGKAAEILDEFLQLEPPIVTELEKAVKTAVQFIRAEKTTADLIDALTRIHTNCEKYKESGCAAGCEYYCTSPRSKLVDCKIIRMSRQILDENPSDWNMEGIKESLTVEAE